MPLTYHQHLLLSVLSGRSFANSERKEQKTTWTKENKYPGVYTVETLSVFKASLWAKLQHIVLHLTAIYWWLITGLEMNCCEYQH